MTWSIKYVCMLAGERIGKTEKFLGDLFFLSEGVELILQGDWLIHSASRALSTIYGKQISMTNELIPNNSKCDASCLTRATQSYLQSWRSIRGHRFHGSHSGPPSGCWRVSAVVLCAVCCCSLLFSLSSLLSNLLLRLDRGTIALTFYLKR